MFYIYLMRTIPCFVISSDINVYAHVMIFAQTGLDREPTAVHPHACRVAWPQTNDSDERFCNLATTSKKNGRQILRENSLSEERVPDRSSGMDS